MEKPRRSGKGSQGYQKEIDWNDIFFKLQLHYPNVEQFNAENFAHCPINIIDKALDIVFEEQLKQSNMNATPIANVGVCLSGSKRAKQSWFNPFPKIIERHEYRDFIDKKVVETFKELSKEGRLPSFIFKEYSDIVKILESQF